MWRVAKLLVPPVEIHGTGQSARLTVLLAFAVIALANKTVRVARVTMVRGEHDSEAVALAA